MPLAMNMDAEKAELLLRAALLDDARNMSERLAALLAEINVLDDETVCISLDMDLWPEEKTSPSAEAIGSKLWIEIEWEMSEGATPFAWPGLGEHVSTTPDYLDLVLSAYRGQKPQSGG